MIVPPLPAGQSYPKRQIRWLNAGLNSQKWLKLALLLSSHKLALNVNCLTLNPSVSVKYFSCCITRAECYAPAPAPSVLLPKDARSQGAGPLEPERSLADQTHVHVHEC